MKDKYEEVRLVGLVGKAGSGKDTLADELAEHGWEKVAFADALKEICINYLGCSHDDVYTQEGKMRFNTTWGRTNRAILQQVGTEAFRNGFDQDVWVKILAIRVKKMLDEGRKVIVTDCRFDNEAQMVEDLGGIIIEMVRDTQSENLSSDEKKHVSENPVNRKFVSFTIDNNGRKSDLATIFTSQLNSFYTRIPFISWSLSRDVHDGLLKDKTAWNALLDARKFANPKPTSAFPDEKKGSVHMEWSSVEKDGKEYQLHGYVYASVDMTDDGILFEAHPYQGSPKAKFSMNFKYGDMDSWNTAMRFVTENATEEKK